MAGCNGRKQMAYRQYDCDNIHDNVGRNKIKNIKKHFVDRIEICTIFAAIEFRDLICRLF
jgi:hypothetical protein